MPRATREPEEIRSIKEEILEAATDLICTEGFDAFSMRKLGDRLGMTAANIYNYYANKSELYLDIQTRGFLLLNGSFAVVLERTSDPVERLVGFAWAYVDFGLKHKDYYDVMLGRNTPKYSDYVGTALEPVARHEKETAVAVIDLVERVISDAIDQRDLRMPFSARVYAIRLWSNLHGLVSLMHTRVLQEVTDDAQEIIDAIVDEIRQTLLRQ
ncbi:MAG: TetR/AcrR family transcriptional regulator [Deltaproteobacteria bacterium]|jgi:AcrR family transcriptional regulator|nr:TetR/AcrR family transcriptional regulator [Deltaproteobacteria bacterium]MBW1875377.1 TetR/AcrR family transcriptional regulator [Deltaproteobacteria bacterium]MBW2211506.1 TetR/AcrR family transcriptional regulator [Deltaproteobacteria bacterium]MBW2214537.1 TetR/AcrR family transcriptional regulator [Deltaproteobacteria bacterium]MBW2379127.1 TetR/AcrR family transcriptional regulator [Deltaproteobacteria bacterium]